MLTLKQKRNGKFELELSMRDFDDEEHVFRYELGQSEETMIPEGLKVFMASVLKTEEGEDFDAKSLQ